MQFYCKGFWVQVGPCVSRDQWALGRAVRSTSRKRGCCTGTDTHRREHNVSGMCLVSSTSLCETALDKESDERASSCPFATSVHLTRCLLGEGKGGGAFLVCVGVCQCLEIICSKG